MSPRSNKRRVGESLLITCIDVSLHIFAICASHVVGAGDHGKKKDTDAADRERRRLLAMEAVVDKMWSSKRKQTVKVVIIDF